MLKWINHNRLDLHHTPLYPWIKFQYIVWGYWIILYSETMICNASQCKFQLSLPKAISIPPAQENRMKSSSAVIMREKRQTTLKSMGITLADKIKSCNTGNLCAKGVLSHRRKRGIGNISEIFLEIFLENKSWGQWFQSYCDLWLYNKGSISIHGLCFLSGVPGLTALIVLLSLILTTSLNQLSFKPEL